MFLGHYFYCQCISRVNSIKYKQFRSQAIKDMVCCYYLLQHYVTAYLYRNI